MASFNTKLKKRNFKRWRCNNLLARHDKRLQFKVLMCMHRIMRYNTHIRTIKINIRWPVPPPPLDPSNCHAAFVAVAFTCVSEGM